MKYTHAMERLALALVFWSVTYKQCTWVRQIGEPEIPDKLECFYIRPDIVPESNLRFSSEERAKDFSKHIKPWKKRKVQDIQIWKVEEVQ